MIDPAQIVELLHAEGHDVTLHQPPTFIEDVDGNPIGRPLPLQPDHQPGRNNTMTTTEDTAADAPQAPATAPESAESATDTQDAADAADDTRSNKEAAKYRRLLRDTEAERDTLREQLNTARTLRVQDALTATRPWADITVAALTAAGHDVPALFTDTGDVDKDALGEAVAATREKLGIQQPRLIVAREGTTPEIRDATSFADAFKPKRDRE